MPIPLPPNATLAYQGKRHQVWEWDQELFDGTHATYSCVVREDTVAVIPFLDPETVLLVREEQPAHASPFWDVPGGCIDPGERAEDAAARELLEETGYRAAQLQFFSEKKFSGMTRFVEYVYLGTGLTDTGNRHLDGGEKIELHPTPWKEAVAMSLRGELRRPEVMLAILALEFDPTGQALKKTFLSA